MILAGEMKDAQPVLMKTCRKCGAVKPATTEFFYRHPAGLYKVTPRCKPCVNEDNKEQHKKRKAADPEKIREQQNARSKKSYYRHIEKNRKYSRDWWKAKRSDPEFRAKLNMKKRAGGAGFTVEQFNALLEAQDGRCAICGVSDPAQKTGSREGALGWNIDHCHKTGKVRFILCAPCNRGLAAFRDDPKALRKAAELLEKVAGGNHAAAQA